MPSKYQQIADEIKSKILSGEYPIGSVIPPELKLQESYQVSRHTVRQAIAQLVNEGFLRKEKGSGTYVDSRFKEKNSGEKRGKTIGVITTYLSNYIFPSIIRGIEEELKKNGYSLLLASTNNDPYEEQKCLENMLVQRVDGLIVEPTKSNQYNPNLSYYLSFKEAGIPVVMINAYYEAIDLPYICVDDVQAGFLATTYMLERGHERLALIVKLDDMQGKLRMKGFIEAYEKRNLSFDSRNIYTFDTGNRDEALENVIQKLLTNTGKVTGIVCYNDEIASTLIRGLIAGGKKVPEDFSVIGQDNSYLSIAGEVPLTTVTHPQEQLGRDAAGWIIQAVEKKSVPDNILYQPEIIKRKSVKRLK